MLLVRFVLLIAAVCAAVVLVATADEWWAFALAVVVLLVCLTEAMRLVLHYTGRAEWLGPSEEVQLQDANLVEYDTGQPKRDRWDASRAAGYADEVARRGLVAVPEGWRGPEGAHRILLLATVPVSASQLREQLPEEVEHGELAVLVVVPTLAETAERYRLGDPNEAVGHAEDVARKTVAALRDARIHVTGHIGPADPAVALSDGLRTYAAERVIVIRHPPGEGRYLEDVPVTPAAETFAAPLTEATVSGRSTNSGGRVSGAGRPPSGAAPSRRAPRRL